MLEPVAVPYLRGLHNATFQQDNTRPHVAHNVLTFLDTEHVRLLPWPARSPDLSPIENVWSMVAERLALQYLAATMVNELWHSVEAAWTAVPIHAIQSVVDSMPMRITSVIAARGGYSGY